MKSTNNFYRLPLRLDRIIRKERPPACTLKDSVAQNLHLLICSYRGEAAYSDDFGCSIWDEEFNIQQNPRWREELCAALSAAVSRFEKRLQLQQVRAVLEQQDERNGKEGVRVRRCLHVEILGTIKKTNEAFHFRGSLFISPLAQQ